jgi:hypothetical protein
VGVVEGEAVREQAAELRQAARKEHLLHARRSGPAQREAGSAGRWYPPAPQRHRPIRLRRRARAWCCPSRA